MLIALHKPFGVLSQFSDRTGTAGATLSDFVSIPGVYPAGRLDKNSEGLLLLTDNGELQHTISHPSKTTDKEYWVQLEGKLEGKSSDEFVSKLCDGIQLSDGFIAAASAQPLAKPEHKNAVAALGPHPGTLAEHRNQNSTWFAVTLTSGKNRIVRRFCAALGHPVLRLVRTRIGNIRLGTLAAGESRHEEWS